MGSVELQVARGVVTTSLQLLEAPDKRDERINKTFSVALMRKRKTPNASVVVVARVLLPHLNCTDASACTYKYVYKVINSLISLIIEHK